MKDSDQLENVLEGTDTEHVPVLKDSWEYDEMKEEDATNGEKGNMKEEANGDEKEGAMENNSKTNITTRKGRKGKGVGNKVKVPSVQMDIM